MAMLNNQMVYPFFILWMVAKSCTNWYMVFPTIPGQCFIDTDSYLVGGTPTPLKNMKVNWDYEIPN